jgi:hypothetical protein
MSTREATTGRTVIRFLRHQPLACHCCGELFNAQAIVLRTHAEALIAIGDAEMLDGNYGRSGHRK